jgi:hypothetical protein
LDDDNESSDDDDLPDLLEIKPDKSDDVIFADEQASEDEPLHEEIDRGLDAQDEIYDPDAHSTRRFSKRSFSVSN